MKKMEELLARGQSIWIDYIEREFIAGGRLTGLINQGVRGLTSNPAIFQKAISEGSAYDAEIAALSTRELAAEPLYETLAIADIRAAADAFRPLHESSGGEDGYVSLEVSPELAHEAEKSLLEAKRLAAAVDRPNLMIKIPATPAGIIAIPRVVAAGLSVNATLIFNSRHYHQVAEAWFTGLELLLEQGKSLHGLASVASFFVSRLDTKLDPLLASRGFPQLQGKMALANAAATYELYLALHNSPRWLRLAEKGARMQRLLWASTGTKDPRYSDTLYVDDLIGAGTVNTAPPATLQAWLDHGRTAAALPAHPAVTAAALSALAEMGISLDAVTEELQKEGVASFARSFASMLASVSEKQKRVRPSLPS